MLAQNVSAAAPLSVSQLNALARHLLESQLFGLWISGEISNLSRAASGHYYFSLKDSKAQVRCALFKGYADKLAASLKEGDHVELTGKISLYEARGEFQITVTELRLAGLGRLFEAYERLKAQLQAEGLFDAARKQALPERPQRIGVVTSLAAAALRDVVSTLRRRMNRFDLIVYPTPVQGAGSEHKIAAAIQAASNRREVDVLLLCRGGGSIEDLWAFNEEVVVRAIAACPIPVVSGVGHETDFTLADFAADVRAPTPTGAAELISPDGRLQWQQLQQQQQRLQQSLRQRYFDGSQQLDGLSRQLRHPQEKLAQQQHTVRHLQQRLRDLLQQQHSRQQQRLLQQHWQVQQQRPDLDYWQQRVGQQAQTLAHGWQYLWQHKQQQWAQRRDLLEAIAPHQVMARGFAVVRNGRGQVIRHADQLKYGQGIQLLFADSEAHAVVTRGNVQQDLFE